MPKESCQSERALMAKPSPCVTCARREECLVHLAQRNLFEAPKPVVHIAHVVSACDGYVPPGGRRSRRLSVVQSLTSKGVANLCNDCGETGACGEHDRLTRLKRVAKANGMTVNFTVVCCSTRPPALIQISEPA